MMIPPFVFSSSLTRRTKIRSCNGLSFMVQILLFETTVLSM
jgi:hypothetical protein